VKLHHLNCATMCPRGERLIRGQGGLLAPGLLTCHVFLLETSDGLVLVDSGLGLLDLEDGGRRLGFALRRFMRPKLDLEETAARQVERLGFTRKDVRHVVLTHLDFDHAGGIADFPEAQIHVHAREHEAAMAPRALLERVRYHRYQLAHGPRWAIHSPEQGEPWFGFERVRAVEGLDVLLIPLHGHSRGHSGVAVKANGRWFLHAGDAYFHRNELAPSGRSCPGGLDFFQRVVQVDKAARVANQERLRALARDHASEVTIVSAHDPVELERARAASASPTETPKPAHA
jgi:glyoxylase-like metal-dependent hydrolase (beta-lactamase superfamily II)